MLQHLDEENLLESSSVTSEIQNVRRTRAANSNSWPSTSGPIYALYALCLAISIAIWLLALHAPLWQDETGSFWTIKDGFSHIWSRQYFSPPVYFYVLWLWAKVVGISEAALRTSSILAMLGAAWLLYLAARELFSRDVAFIATIIFCLHPIVIFESVDVRPYAFAVLATNAAILVLLRLRHNDSNWLAAVFGLLAATIVYFHFLFATILPAFVVCFFVIKTGTRRALWRQFGIAAAVIVLAFLPLIPGLYFMFHTAGSHVYEPPPQISEVLWTLWPGFLLYIFLGALIIAGISAALMRRGASQNADQRWRIVVCASLGLVPLLILYGVSAATPIHMFIARHRLVAIPGLALCWALLVERYLNKPVRLLFCVALVAVTSFQFFRSPEARQHEYTWKYALAVAEKNAAPDNAPVLMCSDFPEADYISMPVGSAKTSRYFAPLSYYQLSVPVVPLPRSLNHEAMRVGSQFIGQAAQKHQRFLAIAFVPSYKTLDWLSQEASADYIVHNLGTYSDIKVLEFDPRTAVTPPAAHSSGQPRQLSVKAASRPAMR